jgi:pimeloyl-ACP methyl ester carboxylesterase
MSPSKDRSDGRAHFVLLHGGWHGGWMWYRIAARLRERGHRVSTPDLPSHGIDPTPPATVTMAMYTDAVAALIDASDEPVILAGHSLGGMVVTAAAEARPRKVAKAVYVAAFLPKSGQSLLDLSKNPASLVGPALRFGAGIVDIDRAAVDACFYGKTGAADRALSHMLLKPNPLAPFGTPVAWTEQGFGSVPRYYVTTREDRAIPRDSQLAMIEAARVAEVFETDADHSPFLSDDERLAKHLEAIASR